MGLNSSFTSIASISLLGPIHWILELELTSLSVDQRFHRKGGACVFLLWPLRAFPKSSPDDETDVKLD